MTTLDSASMVIGDHPFWTDGMIPDAFVKIQEERLKLAQAALDRMIAVEGERTIENTLGPLDEAYIFLDSAGQQASLIQEVHPDEKFREAAEDISQKIAAFQTDLSLNRDIYERLAAVDVSDADPETRFYVEKSLREFRLAGVDKDDATRSRIKELNDELVLIGQEFARNIRDDEATVVVDDISELDGLPQDYIDSHKPGPDGKILLTIDHPDSIPVMTYARSEALRKRMYFAVNNRAFPQNMAVLDRMISRRYELAKLSGFPSWAAYVTANKMVKTPENASDFITKIVAASEARAGRDYQELLARKRKDVPAAVAVDRWETGFYSEMVSKENYQFDSQMVRPYFPYKAVKQGVLDVSAELFGVSFKHLKNAPVWDPLVECWEMFEGGKLIGRFYLDMHPRAGKYSHAAQFTIRNGVAGKQIPEAALVCNLPGGEPGDPGLMEYKDVVTLFHEFGHLLHTLFAGHHRWIGVSGIQTEWDFVEAPSQMLEEWTRDAVTLQRFARHYQTGEFIPDELVEKMNEADEFGKGFGVRRQMVYARLSLSIFDRPPSEVNTDALVRKINDEYLLSPNVDGTHMQTSFGHLDGYSAIYYTYMWSLVIAKDMFSKFNKSDLFDTAIAERYRRAVLDPGGSKHAEELVEDFLGRKSTFNAYQDWLNASARPGTGKHTT